MLADPIMEWSERRRLLSSLPRHIRNGIKYPLGGLLAIKYPICHRVWIMDAKFIHLLFFDQF